MTHTVIVMPCYNEADRLDVPKLLDFVREHEQCTLLMVNDGSSDRTRDVLQGLHEASPERIAVHDLDANSGKAEAVRQGMLRAFDFEPDLIAFCDADLATPLEAVWPYVDVFRRLPDVQVVIGSRLTLLGRSVQRRAVRRWLGRCFSCVASWALGIPIRDTQCGAKMFRATPATKALFEQPFLSRWIFDVEILARMIVASGQSSIAQSVYEFPLDSWREVPGSKLKGSDFVKAMLEMLGIYRTYFLGRTFRTQASMLDSTVLYVPTTEPSCENESKRDAA